MSAPETTPAEVFDRALAGCREALAGHGPGIQGAVLADLVAIWLAGMICDNPFNEIALRETLLSLHVKSVRRLLACHIEETERRNNNAATQTRQR